MASSNLVPQSPFRAPIEVPIIERGSGRDGGGKLHYGWAQWLQIFAQQMKTPANQTAPATANSPGQHGQMALGGGNVYFYDGTVGKWIKFAPVPF